MRVLAIESSCSAAGVAVINEEKVESEIFLDYKLQHSTILFPMIENLLKLLEITINDIDAVAVSGGPGSFTGLRIGLAAAKGIAQGRNKKFIAVSSLDAMAFAQVGFDGIICPIMNALRDNVYTCLYRWNEGRFERICEYEALHIKDLIERLKGNKVMFCGDAMLLHKNTIIEELQENAYFAPKTSLMPKASALGELALLRLKEGNLDNIYTYSPIYIRQSQAEREYERRMRKNLE
ncbi:tRNA (adenosine(37)-N6)-threonylcarbamoyltransferase complex dimerization subunit type 1 TsaB [Caloramator sp. E03]|uniref:tRNA (adenosine(37)-N6)-threonylcarbamoyltransferase complex dimerization subunit type 1 TsaB n=1 Tax=Caloramator sp. E03 TaxID=2576307 RepID=UPI001110AF86|nr:tRNA (adenosine(37)-N6)-threonylcarbamoyltransferase complex dimerization subunit type 1 TsaB [Caloramator sp. E03]QCX33966.1 tRNA (adenosine(37)-N6)-threonylcarbamoyltransferase complex dimerization subunit type 1 TsaB [Caloramator sp. E03]